MGSSRDDDTTELTSGDSKKPLGLVIEGEPRQTYTLHESSVMTIGRSGDVDIRLDHSSVSRRHASIQLLGGKVHLRDERSVNGTFVRGEAMDGSWRAIDIGAVIELGHVIAVVRRLSSAAPRRLWPHGYFEGRVEEEAARCRRNGGRFAVLRLSAQQSSSAVSIEEVLADRPSRQTIPIDSALVPGLPVDDPRPTMRFPQVRRDEPARDVAQALRDEMADLERDRIHDAVARCGGNQSAAARMLGMSRGTLVSRLDQYGVPRPRKPH